MHISGLVFAVLLQVTELIGKDSPSEKRLRVTIAEYPVVAEGLQFNTEGELIKMEGMGVNYLNWLSQRFHYPYTIAKFYRRIKEYFPIGAFKNGSWDGMMGDITQDVADLAIGAFGARFTYIPYAEMTFPWTQTHFSLYIPYPEESISIWSFLKPFTSVVWALLVVSFMVVACVIWKLQNTTASPAKERKQRSFSYGTILLYLLAVMSGQGGCWDFKGKALITLGTTWCLTSVVLVNGYNGLLTSYMTTISREPLVNSLEELAMKPDIKFYSYQNSYVIFTFVASTMGAKKVLGQVLLDKPERILPSLEDCLQVVAERKGTCFMEGSAGDRFIRQTFKENGNCVATSVAKRFLEFNPVFLLPKNSTFFSNINKGMIWANAMGFQPLWRRKYQPKVPECELHRASTSKAKKLMLSSFYGPFVMLFVGYLLAAVVFIGERVAHKRAKKNPISPSTGNVMLSYRLEDEEIQT